jgi:dipeptidyl aminopeptidase/acylaminoacyl peptidase
MNTTQRITVRSAVAMLLAMGAASSPESHASAAAQRRFTVKDSIELSTFGRPAPAAFGDYLPIREATMSPDGTHFVVVTTHGDLASGKREGTIWLYDTRAVQDFAAGRMRRAPPVGKVLTRMSNASNRKPIENWRWASDSGSVLFCGADDDGSARLYRISLAGGEPVALSRPEQDIGAFDERNGLVVYFAHAPIRAQDLYQAGGPSLPDAVMASRQNILPLLFPHWMATYFRDGEEELWKVEGNTPSPVLDAERHEPIRLKDSLLSLSPDGRRVLTTRFAKHIPKSWERYRPLKDIPGYQFEADTPGTEGADGYFRARQYQFIDLGSGTPTVVADMPLDTLAETDKYVVPPAWSPDGTRVAVLGLYPPIDATTGEPQPIYPCAIGVLGVFTGKFACVHAASKETAKIPFHDRPLLAALKWDGKKSRLFAEYNTPNAPNAMTPRTFTEATGGTWAESSSAAERGQGNLLVYVTQALDDPPVLTARIGNGTARALWNPNPQLDNIARGTAALYHWKDSKGEPWTGALVEPPNFTSGRRYPLVIQTHQLDRDKFLVDGPSATGFAARALAARDILVLQADEVIKTADTPQESETGADGYRSAIRQLGSEGKIDPANVGIITWSHMGAYTIRALVDDPGAYKAATFAEAGFNSYGEYLINIDYMGPEREKMFRAQVGPKPFGPGLAEWVRLSAGFHTDRVCTPILWQTNDPVSLVYGWEQYASLRAQDKPVDLVYIRNGDHVLAKPLERLLEQGMNVDWYDYWLNGHEDPDPAKADQYKRWAAMKPLPACAPAQPAGNAGG